MKWLGRLALVLLIPAAVVLLLALVLAIPGAGLLCLAAFRRATELRRQCAAIRSAWAEPADAGDHGIASNLARPASFSWPRKES